MSSKWIYGWGGHARVINRHWKADCIIDDDPLKGCKDTPSKPWSKHIPITYRYGLIAIGDNMDRKKIRDRIEQDEPMYGMLITHDAIQPYCGIGTVVLDGAIVQPGTWIGEHVIINTGATVDHDCRIGDFVHIAPGCHLCGNVTVGEGAFIGAGTIVTPGSTIEPWAFIKAGSLVTPEKIVARI